MRLGRIPLIRRKYKGFPKTHSVIVQKTIILLLAAFFLYLMILFVMTVRPLIASLAENKAKNIGIKTINKAVSSALEKNNVKYENLITLMQNSAGEVIALKANTIEMNRLKNQIQDNVQQALWEMNTETVSFPIGNVFGNEFLSGLGPVINVKILPVGMALVNFDSSFSAEGINQTKHEIYLKVNASISIILPGMISGSSVETKVPVAETIIVGNVPSYYVEMSPGEVSSSIDIPQPPSD